MRKLFPVLAFLPLLACNLMIVAPKPAQTSTQGIHTPQSTGPAPVATSLSTLESAEIVPIPVTSVQIEGMPYQAYQIPGDPFRFVCQEPCPHDPQYIYAEYAGFRLAHAMLIKLTGVDTLAELQPVDMHLGYEDAFCRNWPGGHASIYLHVHQAYTCTSGPGLYSTIEETIRMAARPEKQYFPLHEYMHTFFFGRISAREGEYAHPKARSFHDFVNPIPSYALGILDPAGFCSYRDPIPWGDFNGRLISELCRLNGFTLPDLALSLIELDKLYLSGGGRNYEDGYDHPVPTVAQYRDILNGLLGSDTTPAFAAACWPPELFGNSYSLVGECVQPTYSGTPTTAK